MNRSQKIEEVSRMEGAIGSKSALLVVCYSAVSHRDMEDIRKELKESDCRMKIVRNSLMKIFAKSRGYEALTHDLRGQNVVIWGQDILKLIKIAHSYEKKFEKFVLTAALADFQVIDRERIKSLADLPSSEHLYAKLIGTINSSVSGVSKVLHCNIRRISLALSGRSN